MIDCALVPCGYFFIDRTRPLSSTNFISYSLITNLAYNVISPVIGEEKSNLSQCKVESSYHPSKTNHVFVGADGSIATDHDSTV